MILALFLLIAGALISLGIFIALKPTLDRSLPRFLLGSASGGLIGALWLCTVPTWIGEKGTAFAAGLLIAPFCILPVVQRLSGREEGLTRAASGLGAGRTARIRYLWVPLLRLPIALASLSFAFCVAVCLLLLRHAHV